MSENKKDSKEVKSEKVQYIALAKELKLVVRPSTSGVVDGRIVVSRGVAIQFHDGIYETEDKKEIEYLDNHPSKGREFHRLEKKGLNTIQLYKEREEKYVKTIDEKESLIKQQQKEIERLQKLAEGQEVANPAPKGGKNAKDEKAAY